MIKRVLAGVGAIGLLLAASGVQAQNGPCTLTNWSSTVGATNLSAGTVADGNRRYAGPCGLRVVLDSAEAYLIDNTPVDETEFNVRFYFFLNNVTSDVTFYQALDGTDAVITAKYDAAQENVDVIFGAALETLTFTDVNTGWNSLEIKWTSAAAATPVAILGGASGVVTKTSSAINTSAFAVDSARLGAINALVANMPSAGSIDFDDYDSRRSGPAPGRLVRGDANGDGVTDGDDQSAVVNEFLLGEFGQGNPDCNEDGLVDGDDQSCIVNVFLGIE